LILKKGQEYKERVEKRRLDKESEELKSCTFVPKINAKSRPRPKTGAVAAGIVHGNNLDDSFKEPLLLKDALCEQPREKKEERQA
jgi:hypothetical protein